MLSKVLSATTIGIDAVLIRVEVDVASRGFPAFNIVGLPSKSIDEAKERVRAAIINASFEMPDSRITVNLAPADIPKEGSGFDLPIAVGILAASGIIDKISLLESIFVGELSLEGRIREVPGVISVATLAREKKIKRLFIPASCIVETSLVDDIEAYPLENIVDLILFLNGEKKIAPFDKKSQKFFEDKSDKQFVFEEIKGQETAKRALEIAAAGFHNIHLKGSPGTGKTLLSRAFPSILPDLEKQEILEVTKIYSAVGLLKNSSFITTRPFRSPHHTTSRIGLIGGGSIPNPGEISLAHRGVLFLDELPEFSRATLEALRQPMEDGEVLISRARSNLIFPCRFILLAASNPCPCGYLGHPKRGCRCFPGAVLKYRKRLSGPLIDRIDINIDVPPVEEAKLTGIQTGETSKTIKNRVREAFLRQKLRLKKAGILTNSQMSPADIKNYCRLTDDAAELLKKAISRLSLSARSYFKTIKVAKTITDLYGLEKIEVHHIAEALQFRAVDA